MIETYFLLSQSCPGLSGNGSLPTYLTMGLQAQFLCLICPTKSKERQWHRRRFPEAKMKIFVLS